MKGQQCTIRWTHYRGLVWHLHIVIVAVSLILLLWVFGGSIEGQ